MSLLQRTASAADVHPLDPKAIVLHGGYGPDPSAPSSTASTGGGGDEDAAGGGGTDVPYGFLSDVVVLHTERREVWAVPCEGPPPPRRSYHTITSVGTK